MLCPWEDESRCEGSRARSCTFSCAEMAGCQIWALSPAVPDSGGPCQSKARLLLAFCWKYKVCLLLWLVLPQSTGHTSAAVSRLTCGWKSCRRKRDTWRQVSVTLKIQERFQDSNTVSLWRILWSNYLAVLYQRQGSLLVAAVLHSSLEVSVNSRGWPCISCTLWSMENIWHPFLRCVQWRLKLMHQSISCCFCSCYGS